jgi:hypothetical protein
VPLVVMEGLVSVTVVLVPVMQRPDGTYDAVEADVVATGYRR